MLTLFYILGFLVLLESIGSLISGIHFHRFVKRALRKETAPYTPPVTVILPFRGIDPGLVENLQALIKQDYPDFEILFVTDRITDTAYAKVQHIVQTADVPARLLVAGPAANRGQKVHNLLYAVQQARPQTEVLVFTDSDARPHGRWLYSLVAPLAQASVGAATGYRWYLPVDGGFWSLVQSAWNGAVLTLLGGHRRNFTWGGAMALRVQTFRQANVAHYWDRALSDDYGLTNALRQAGLAIAFVPQCLTMTHQDTTLRELLEWSSRQMLITRIYSPGLWKFSLISQTNYTTIMTYGLVLSGVRGLQGIADLGPLILVTLVFFLGVLKGSLRLRSVKIMRPEHAADLARHAWGYRLLAPLVSWLTLYTLLKSLTTNRVCWRGIVYEMRSPFDTRIVKIVTGAE